MSQEYASLNNKKRFSSILFTVLTLLLIGLVYFAIQKQNTIESKASQNNNICNVATDEICRSSVISSQCEAKSFGCCKKRDNNCVKKNNAVINCKILPQNVCGINSNGIDLSNLCEWNTTRSKCIDKTTTPPTLGRCVDKPIIPQASCNNFTTQATCLPTSDCLWLNNNCSRVCSRIGQQDNCTQRTDCEWKNNACTVKSGGTGNVTLDLKLSYQGIVTLPQTKTQLKVKVKIVDAANKEKEKDTSIFTADSNGIWSGSVTFEDVDLSQKYYILIKGPMHIQKKICKADAADPNPGYYSCQFGNITLTSGVNTFDFSKVKMLVGDLDQNGLVNREDTGPLLSALLLDLDQRKSAGVLEKLDLNLDGIVEPKDWSLMLEALKIKYDEK